MMLFLKFLINLMTADALFRENLDLKVCLIMTTMLTIVIFTMSLEKVDCNSMGLKTQNALGLHLIQILSVIDIDIFNIQFY